MRVVALRQGSSLPECNQLQRCNPSFPTNLEPFGAEGVITVTVADKEHGTLVLTTAATCLLRLMSILMKSKVLAWPSILLAMERRRAQVYAALTVSQRRHLNRVLRRLVFRRIRQNGCGTAGQRLVACVLGQDAALDTQTRRYHLQLPDSTPSERGVTCRLMRCPAGSDIISRAGSWDPMFPMREEVKVNGSGSRRCETRKRRRC